MKPKRLSFEEFKKIYSKVPRLCIDLIIKTNEGILLTKRAIPPYKGYWHTPGGTVLLHEKLKEAAERIAQEEIGSKIKIIKFLGTMEFPPDEITTQSISIVYLAKPLSKNLKGSNQGKDLKFFKKIPPKTIKEQKIFRQKLNKTGNAKSVIIWYPSITCRHFLDYKAW